MTGASISICAKGARRQILSALVCVKRVLLACPPHVVVLTMVYALGSRYAVALVTEVALGLGSPSWWNESWFYNPL